MDIAQYLQGPRIARNKRKITKPTFFAIEEDAEVKMIGREKSPH
jgi:hypothetical protein